MTAMRPPEAVLLDVGGVLLLPDPERIRRTLAPFALTPSDAILERAHHRSLSVATRGRATYAGVDWPTYFATYVDTCGAAQNARSTAAAAVTGAFTGDVWTHPVPGAREFLGSLASAGIPVALVSNADGTVEELLRRAGLGQVGPGPGVPVAAVLDSGLEGVEKPDPRLFHIALDRLGVAADAALHVGDSALMDVCGALAAGVRPVHFVPYGDCDLTCGAVWHARSHASITRYATR